MKLLLKKRKLILTNNVNSFRLLKLKLEIMKKKQYLEVFFINQIFLANYIEILRAEIILRYFKDKKFR